MSHDDTSDSNGRFSSAVAASRGARRRTLAFILFSLIEAVLVGLVLGALVRVPVFRTSGTARLVTDADPGAVRAEFEGETPPPLAFQWGSPMTFARQTTA